MKTGTKSLQITVTYKVLSNYILLTSFWSCFWDKYLENSTSDQNLQYQESLHSPTEGKTFLEQIWKGLLPIIITKNESQYNSFAPNQYPWREGERINASQALPERDSREVLHNLCQIYNNLVALKCHQLNGNQFSSTIFVHILKIVVS